MVNPDSYPLLSRVILYRRGTAGTITYDEDTNSKLIDYEFEFNENYPKKATIRLDNRNYTSTINILNSSCAQWSGSVTGALRLGDYLKFGLFRRGTSTVDYHFKGVITDLVQNGSGELTIIAYDFSKRLEYVKKSFVYYKSYRDSVICDFTAGWPYNATVPNDSDIQVPMSFVGWSDQEITQHFGNGTGTSEYELADDTTKKVAQPFVADGSALVYLVLYINASSYNPNKITLTIETDNDGQPSGVAIYTNNNITITDGAGVSYLFDLKVAGSAPMMADTPLAKGSRYWVVVKCNTAPGGGASVMVDSEQTSATVLGDYASYNGSAWSKVTGEQLQIIVYQLGFTEQTPDTYYFDDAAKDMDLYGVSAAITASTEFGADYRAMFSYYYGTRTLEEIVLKLIKQNTGLLGDVSTNLDRTFKTYYTKGKTIAECLRECMDLYETGGTWSGKQHVMGHYEDGSSIQRLKVGKRLNVTDDSEAVTISLPADRPSNSDEWVIIGDPEIKKTTKLKYAAVMLIGQSQTGEPLITVRHDKAKSTSFWTALSGLTETLKVTDENIRDLTQLDAEAIRLMDAVTRDVWEGAIQLSGQHLGLWDTDTTSDSYGSGKILKMYWSPLGISAVKMKVTRLILRKNSTEIYVNNIDTLILNKLSRSMGTMEKIDAFVAPTGSAENVFLETYDATVATDAALYMELEDEDGTDLSNMHRVLCTRFANNANLNANTYHAEFERQNGYSAKQVRYIKLYTKLTGGSLRTTIDLQRTVSSIDIDEKVDKFKTNRLVIEVTHKAS